MRFPLLLATLALATLGASAQHPFALDSLVQHLPTYQNHIAQQPDAFELQVVYRPLTGPDSGTTQRYNVDPSKYFYPASTVKLPVAALALEQIAQLGILGLTTDSPMEVGASQPPQTPSTQRIGLPKTPATITGHVRDIAIVSSNEAYNRMYEWLGPNYINRALQAHGWKTRIIHRVGNSAFKPEDNTQLNPVAFRSALPGKHDTVYYRGAAKATTPYAVRKYGEQKGLGGYDDSTATVIHEPFDFSRKNFISLEDLADVLQAVVQPSTLDSIQRFRMLEKDRNALVEALSTRPAESDNPLHHDKPDGYVNFLYYGGEGAWEIGGPKIYNKVGDAYGTLTDVAIFEDEATNRRYLLAATLLVNANQIFNDGIYEYDEVGFPFLRELGRAVWQAAHLSEN